MSQFFRKGGIALNDTEWIQDFADRRLQYGVSQTKLAVMAGIVVVKHFCNTLFENSPGISSFKWCFPIIVGMRTDMIVPYVHISV